MIAALKKGFICEDDMRWLVRKGMRQQPQLTAKGNSSFKGCPRNVDSIDIST